MNNHTVKKHTNDIRVAIPRFCLEHCCRGNFYEAKYCETYRCPLWLFRIPAFTKDVDSRDMQKAARAFCRKKYTCWSLKTACQMTACPLYPFTRATKKKQN